MRRFFAGCGKGAIVALVFLASGRAAAQDVAFGEAGHVALSAERLFGYVHTKATASAGGTDASESYDTLTLLASPVAGATGYAWPRIGFDGFISRSISLGGSAGFFNVSPSQGSISGFLLAPRVGFAPYLGPRVAVWLRGGFTFWHISSDPGGGGISTTLSAYALTLEAPLVLLAAPRIGFLAGPTLDLGLGGSQSTAGASTDRKYTDFGVQFGMLVFL